MESDDLRCGVIQIKGFHPLSFVDTFAFELHIILQYAPLSDELRIQYFLNFVVEFVANEFWLGRRRLW